MVKQVREELYYLGLPTVLEQHFTFTGMLVWEVMRYRQGSTPFAGHRMDTTTLYYTVMAPSVSSPMNTVSVERGRSRII